jgi:hypothetical protein
MMLDEKISGFGHSLPYQRAQPQISLETLSNILDISENAVDRTKTGILISLQGSM